MTAGGAVGFVNGLLGGGGGMIAVPALAGTGLSEKRAHATAIATVLPASAASAVVYLFHGAVRLFVLVPVALGALLGGFLGAGLLKRAPSKFVTFVFALLMLTAGVKMILS